LLTLADEIQVNLDAMVFLGVIFGNIFMGLRLMYFEVYGYEQYS